MPFDRSLYPADWDAISARIRSERAGERCECTGQCGLHCGRRCVERHAEKAQWANGKVVLTVAHLNHAPSDCRDENLLAMCQTCHLRYDHVLHLEHAFNKRRSELALGDLFDGLEEP